MMFAEQLIGVPYVWGGRAYDGADCYGLVYLFYRDVLQHPIERYDGQPALEDPEIWTDWIREGASRHWFEVDKASGQYGDVLLYRVGRFLHCSVYLGGNLLLQTRPEMGSFTEKIEGTKWIRKDLMYFRRG